MSNLPPITQQPIIYVDGTPDEHYVLRILRAYRENCNCKWETSAPNAAIDYMNDCCDKRAVLLDKAIEILTTQPKLTHRGGE